MRASGRIKGLGLEVERLLVRFVIKENVLSPMHILLIHNNVEKLVD